MPAPRQSALAVLLVALLLTSCWAPTRARGEGSPILSVIFSDAQPRSSELARLLVSLGVLRIEPAFGDAELRSLATTEGAPTDRALPDLARFQHLVFADAASATAALPLLIARPELSLVEPLSESQVLSFPDDPYFESWPNGWQIDPQWSLRNQGTRGEGARCAPAVVGADVGIDATWRQIEDGVARLGRSFPLDPWLGAPEVVLGFLDVGILDAHPDLSVLDDYSNDPRLSLCLGHDWCGDHGTKMAGLAAARTGNGVGVAGVAGECSLLDLLVPACACGSCESESENCLYVSSLWHTKLLSSLDVDLGHTSEGRERRLAVINASFASNGFAPEEVLEALWIAHRSGVLIVAATGDQSFAQPAPRYPANIPFVLGVGGSTWEDRFWDTKVSCYGGSNGTTIAAGQVDLVAPASGPVVTTFPYPNPSGVGLYASTTGQCSAAAALVTGAAGLVQAVAQRSVGRALSPEDLGGVLLASARPFAVDPTLNPTCPPADCPRADYGRGIVDLENALFVAQRAAAWQRRTITAASVARGDARSWTIEALSPDFVYQGETWREFRVRAEVDLEPRPNGGPSDLPRFIAWPSYERSTTPLAYGSAPNRARGAFQGITSCALELDPSTGRATLTGANFARVSHGFEEPLVPWENLGMSYVTWAADGRPHDPWPIERWDAEAPVLSVGPNPARGPVRVSWSAKVDAARLEIFDSAGRLVRSFPPAYSPAFDTVWDGKDAEGRLLPEGIYWLRLRAGDRVASRPIVRLR